LWSQNESNSAVVLAAPVERTIVLWSECGYECVTSLQPLTHALPIKLSVFVGKLPNLNKVNKDSYSEINIDLSLMRAAITQVDKVIQSRAAHPLQKKGIAVN